MPQLGRLIPEITATGAVHMATDAWLLNQLIAGHIPPTLRFYRWSPTALSLGYHQQRWPEHWHHLAWQGKSLDLVRRPTGGRAVLHQGDFTYAIALPTLGIARHDLYKHICDGLIAAWRTLGLSLGYGSGGRGYHHQPDCFATATAADLVTTSGYKLIGSAQLRRGNYLLQQGTMRLWPDPDLHHQVFRAPLDTTNHPAVIPAQCSGAWLNNLTQLIVDEFSRRLEIDFDVAPLTELEHQQAWDLHQHYTVTQ